MLNYIILIGNLLGLMMVGIAILGFNKLVKQHRKVSNDDFLLENEKQIQNKSIIILVIGFSISVITSLIILLLLFLKYYFKT